ncbi:hypothetical protein D9619_005710 [Psilocybe cf. subviscida]|uniref:PhoD-like phosphatase metallophosphatase domain-containing protein n=1 Tax=Psilocybe cf. subviscida TaxID=2480587 RepID=A0A8H5BW30_9AGAR|nr:hypothetical protein D9619_005710 [Psilocybe cf. subviscida]
MSYPEYLPALFSTLFRLFSYIFLQIIPTRLARGALPVSFLLYVVTAYLYRPRPLPPALTEDEIDEKRDRVTLKPPALSPPDGVPTEAAPLGVLLFTLPTRKPILAAINVVINLLLLAASADLAFSPFFDSADDVAFTRVGAVYPDSVKIAARVPYLAVNETVRVLYREHGSLPPGGAPTSWSEGPAFDIALSHDWVDTVRVNNLWPSTEYEYVLTSSDPSRRPIPAAPITFRTFPDPDSASRLRSLLTPAHTERVDRLRFIATSCIVPNFPYRGPSNRRTIKGFDLLAKYLGLDSTHHRVNPLADFMLFLGDFIYADVPMYIGDDPKAYQRLYRRNYASPSFRKVYEHLPIFHTYDDHEIMDNYVGAAQDLPPFTSAAGAYDVYAGDSNYDPPASGALSAVDTHPPADDLPVVGILGSNTEAEVHQAHQDAAVNTQRRNYYEFSHGNVAFFVLDTRRYRSGVAPDIPEEARTMLGEEQLRAVENWLVRVNQTSTFKFLVSSVPFTSLWTFDAQIDTWAAYSHEKARLLDVMHTVPNIVVISGDRHEFAHIEFEPELEQSATGVAKHIVREVSTSPLNMFYIPLLHTLRPRSDASFVRTRNVTVTRTVPVSQVIVREQESGGQETVVVQEEMVEVQEEEVQQEEIPLERVVKYIPVGNSKWSSFEVDESDPAKPTLRVETVIDGKVAYEFEVIGEPMKAQNPVVGLGAAVQANVKGLFHKIGLKPSRWF